MIEKAIHLRWASTAALVALIAADRFVTGSSLIDPDTPLPAAVLDLEGTQRDRTNSGHTAIRNCRIRCWVRDHADGAALRGPLATAFENTDWTVGADGSVLSCRIENDFAVQEDDGVWQFVFNIELMTREA